MYTIRELQDRVIQLEAEVVRLTRHADAGWHQYKYWNGRYLEAAKQRAQLEAQLISMKTRTHKVED